MKRALALVLVLVCFCFAGMNKSMSFSKSKVTISEKFQAKDGDNYLKINYGNLKTTHILGEPQLPVVIKQYIISSHEKPVDLVINKGETREYKLDQLILPGQESKPTSINATEPTFQVPDSKIYNSNKLFPKEPIQIIKDGWYDGNHIVTIAFSQFNIILLRI